jgi:hypothetical protein
MKTRLLFFISLSIFLFSCSKDNVTATDYITEVSEHADDQSRFSAAVDASVNDANSAMEASIGFSGKNENIQSLICDATITIDTTGANRTLIITYNGANCLGNYTRTGSIQISMSQAVRWRNAGATINVNFQNLKITRLSDNKSITINGLQQITNLSGGLLINLAGTDSIIHTLTSNNMSVTFDNGNQRTWQVARRRSFRYNNGIVITTTGMHTSGTTTGITEWGTNRFGHIFTTAIAQPLIIRQDCNFRLVSGKINHWTDLFNAQVMFGLDAAGNPTGCPGASDYYLKIEWRGPSNIVRTVILPY